MLSKTMALVEYLRDFQNDDQRPNRRRSRTIEFFWCPPTAGMADEELLRAFSIYYIENGAPPPKRIHRSASPDQLARDIVQYGKSKIRKKSGRLIRMMPRGNWFVGRCGLYLFRDTVFIVDEPFEIKRVGGVFHGPDAVVWKDLSITSFFHGIVLDSRNTRLQWSLSARDVAILQRLKALGNRVEAGKATYPSGVTMSVLRTPFPNDKPLLLEISMDGIWETTVAHPRAHQMWLSGGLSSHDVDIHVTGAKITDIVHLSENLERRLLGFRVDSSGGNSMPLAHEDRVLVTDENGNKVSSGCIHGSFVVQSLTDGKYFYESSTWWEKTEIHLEEGHYILVEVAK